MMLLNEVESSNWAKFESLFAQQKRGRVILFQNLRLRNGLLSVDDFEKPSVAVYRYPPFNFVAGNADSNVAIDLLKTFPPMNVIVPMNDQWSTAIKTVWGNELHKLHRTMLNSKLLNIDNVRELKKKIPDQFSLHQIDPEILKSADKSLIGQIPHFFGSLQGFLEKGFGYCALHNKKVVCVAYTAFPFIDEFEIEVETLDNHEYRRKGIATAVCAALIEHALENGITPHWDAANKQSVGLALKLGFTDPEPHEAYYRKHPQESEK